MTAAIGISPELAAPDPFASLTPRHHGAIAADPPWTFYVRSSNGEGRSASQHYRTMGLEALLQLPVAESGIIRRMALSLEYRTTLATGASFTGTLGFQLFGLRIRLGENQSDRRRRAFA